jgi:translocation and assembly module TamB
MLRRLLAALIFASTVCVAGALAFLRTDLVAENLCAYAVATIEEATHAKVRVASCQVDAVKGTLVIDGLQVGDPGGVLQIAAARVFAQVEVRALQQKLRLVQLHVDHPDVKLSIDTSGPARKRQQGACLPDVLDRFELGRVTIRRASVDVDVKSEGVRIQVPRLSASVHGKGDELTAAIATATGTVKLPGRSVGLLSLRADAKVDLRGAGTVELTRADVIGTEATAYVKGKLQDLCKPRLEATANVRVDDLETATSRLLPGVLEGVKGSLQVDGVVRAGPGAFEARGDLRLKALQLEGLSPGEAKASFQVGTERLTIGKLQVGVGKGEVQAQAEIGFGAGVPFTADVAIHDIELADLLQKLGIPRSHVVLRASGKGRIQGPLSPLALRGEASVELADFAILDRRFEERAQAQRLLEFPKGHLATALSVSADKVVLEGAKLEVGQSLLQVDGDLSTDPKKGPALRARADKLDLTEFRGAKRGGHIGPIDWSGSGTFSAEVQGAYGDPDITAEALLSSFRFLDLSLGDVAAKIHFAKMMLTLSEIDGQKGRSVYTGDVQLDMDKDDMPVEAHLDLAEGSHLHDLVDLAIGLVPTLSTVHDAQDVDGLVSGTLHARGPVARPDGFAQLALSDVHLWGQLFAEGETEMSLHGGERLQLQKLELRHVAGKKDSALLEMSGRFGPDWVLEMDARTQRFDLADLDAAVSARLTGPLESSARIRGVASHPKIDAEMTFTKGKSGKAELGDGAFTLKVDGKALVSHGTVGPHVFDAVGRLEGDFGFTSTLALRFDDLSGYFATFAPGSGLESGSLSADVTAAGSLLTWRDASGTVQVTNLGLKWTDPKKQTALRFHNDRNGQLTFGPGGVDIKLLSLVEENQRASATLRGRRGRDTSLDLRLSALMDGKLLLAFAQGGDNPAELLIEHAAGTAQLEASVGGTDAQPEVLGSLRVENGELRVRNSPVAARELNGRVSFTQKAVVIEDMSAKLNGGPARIEGSVRLKDFSPEWLDLQARVSEVPVRLQENLGCTLEDGSHLALVGAPLEPTLSGKLVLSRMKYTEDINLERQLVDFTRRPPRALAKSDVLVHFNVDVQLSKKGVRIENNLARADLSGDFTVTGTSRRPGLLGSVNTEHGTANFRGNEFQIEQGVINFTDRQSIRPSFDLNALANVKDYKVRLHAYGTPQDPHMELKSEPALAEADLAFLLTFGFVQSNIQQGGVNAADTGAAIAVEALNKVTGFSEEVRRFIPKNTILRNPTIDFTSDFSVASNRVEPMARFHSQFITEKADLKILQGLSTRRGRGVLSYRLTDAITAQGSVDNEHLYSGIGTDLGFDLSLRWEGD